MGPGRGLVRVLALGFLSRVLVLLARVLVFLVQVVCLRFSVSGFCWRWPTWPLSVVLAR
jgi:hypothetical protein